MVCGTSLKFIVISLVVFYTSYLYMYKCESVSALESILHPLNHHHKCLCDYVDKSETFVKPHLATAQNFLDKNVHQTDFFKKHQIHEKIVGASTAAYDFAHPYLIEVYKVVEIIEVHAYNYLSSIYEKIVALYHGTVAPKVKEVIG